MFKASSETSNNLDGGLEEEAREAGDSTQHEERHAKKRFLARDHLSDSQASNAQAASSPLKPKRHGQAAKGPSAKLSREPKNVHLQKPPQAVVQLGSIKKNKVRPLLPFSSEQHIADSPQQLDKEGKEAENSKDQDGLHRRDLSGITKDEKSITRSKGKRQLDNAQTPVAKRQKLEAPKAESSTTTIKRKRQLDDTEDSIAKRQRIDSKAQRGRGSARNSIEKPKRAPHALKNFANSCYMNAPLQALHSIDEVAALQTGASFSIQDWSPLNEKEDKVARSKGRAGLKAREKLRKHIREKATEGDL